MKYLCSYVRAAVATKPHDAGEASIRQQQQLAPELKALLQLSKDRHSGWIARFDEALKPQKHPAGALTQSLSSKSYRPEPLESHDKVRPPARPYFKSYAVGCIAGAHTSQHGLVT